MKFSKDIEVSTRWTARDRLHAHRILRGCEDMADEHPWNEWLLRLLVRLIRRLDADIENARGRDDPY